MKFDTKNVGTWFWFGEQEENGGVCLRVCAGKDIREIDRLTSQTKKEYKRGNRHEYKVVDEKMYDELLWDFCIVDWKQVGIDGRKDVECSKENKILLMNHSVEFASFVGNCLERLSETELTAGEAEEKNSRASQNG